MKRSIRTPFSVMLALAWAVAFMPDPAAAASRHADRPQVRKEAWTFAFYLAGDNSLENEQVRNLREICEGAGSVRGVRMVVFFDRDDDTSDDNLSTTWQGTRVMAVGESCRDTLRNSLSVDVPESFDARRFRSLILGRVRHPRNRDLILRSYERRKGRYFLNKVSPEARERIRNILIHDAGYLLPLRAREYSNLESTDPGTLNRFMHFVRDSFPADRYLLCITGHSDGWAARDTMPPDTAKRHTRDYSRQLKVSALKQALHDDPPDVLVLDTCSMAEMETAWALKDCARYLVASQRRIPSMGLNYRKFLMRLGKPGKMKPRIMAFEAVEAYRDSFTSTPYALSSSAIDLHGSFRHFVPAFQRYAADPSHHAALRQSAVKAWRIRNAGVRNKGMLDLTALLSSLSDSKPETVALKKPVLVNHISINCSLSGMSVFLPQSGSMYRQLKASYLKTDFARDFPEGWASALPQIIPGE